MADRVHHNPTLIFSAGTQVVALRNITAEGGRILHLPETARATAAMNDLLVRLRLQK